METRTDGDVETKKRSHNEKSENNLSLADLVFGQCSSSDEEESELVDERLRWVCGGFPSLW